MRKLPPWLEEPGVGTMIVMSFLTGLLTCFFLPEKLIAAFISRNILVIRIALLFDVFAAAIWSSLPLGKKRYWNFLIAWFFVTLGSALGIAIRSR